MLKCIPLIYGLQMWASVLETPHHFKLKKKWVGHHGSKATASCRHLAKSAEKHNKKTHRSEAVRHWMRNARGWKKWQRRANPMMGLTQILAMTWRPVVHSRLKVIKPHFHSVIIARPWAVNANSQTVASVSGWKCWRDLVKTSVAYEIKYVWVFVQLSW